MALVCRLGERLEKLFVVRRAGGVIAAHALLDILGRSLEGPPACLLSLDAAAHPVRHHHQKGEPLALGADATDVGQAGLANHHLSLQLADEEVVLILLSDLSGVSDAVDIDLAVERLALGTCGCRCGHGDPILRGDYSVAAAFPAVLSIAAPNSL